MERPVFHHSIFLIAIAEQLKGLVLRRRGECKITGVIEHPAALYNGQDAILGRQLVVRSTATQRAVECPRGAPALARMRLVDHNGEAATAMSAAHVVQNER